MVLTDILWKCEKYVSWVCLNLCTYVRMCVCVCVCVHACVSMYIWIQLCWCWQELPAEPRQNGHVQKGRPQMRGYHDDSDDVSFYMLCPYLWPFVSHFFSVSCQWCSFWSVFVVLVCFLKDISFCVFNEHLCDLLWYFKGYFAIERA